MSGKNKQPLSVTHPELAREWHPTKNRWSEPRKPSFGTLFPEMSEESSDVSEQILTPADVTAGSGMKVWWKCSKGPDHEWEATVAARAGSDRTGCPCCSNYKVSVTNSLASCFPEIAAEWHPTKNGELTSADVVFGSNREFWWKCPKGEDHEWEDQPNNRTSPVLRGPQQLTSSWLAASCVRDSRSRWKSFFQ